MTTGFDLDELERLLAAATPDPAPRSLRELDERGYARRAFGNAMIEAAPAILTEIRELRATVATLGDSARAGANVLDAKDTEIHELRAENARLREGASWPSYDVDVPDAWESYLLELCGFEHRRGWAHLPATFRWHEFWERLGKTITARAALGEPQ